MRGIQMPTGVAAGCNKEDIMSNVTGWGIFANVFPPGIPKKPGFGIGVDVGTSPVSGQAPYPVPCYYLSLMWIFDFHHNIKCLLQYYLRIHC